ncbi:MAG: Fe-S metabolism protein SufE [Chitinophagales bacterium]|nr:MAG: Fe-S metabolism protein SufE [Chitinophagales bacterium]
MAVVEKATIDRIQDEIIEEFSMLDDPMDRYEYIIEIGKQLPPLDEKYKTDANLVKGCLSKVWLHSYQQDGRVVYEADSNTAITKGIIALLIRVLSNQKPDDIVHADLYFIPKIGLQAHLTSQRANGLAAMIKQMKLDAIAMSRQSN